MCCSMFSRIPGLYPPDASSTPQIHMWQPKLTLDIAKCNVSAGGGGYCHQLKTTDSEDELPIKFPFGSYRVRLGWVSGQYCLFLVFLTMSLQSSFIGQLARAVGTWLPQELT